MMQRIFYVARDLPSQVILSQRSLTPSRQEHLTPQCSSSLHIWEQNPLRCAQVLRVSRIRGSVNSLLVLITAERFTLLETRQGEVQETNETLSY
ncbi:hypothetical protein CEXT_504041 [Caerostris extrusa]|uniref:Uncharacterized protein n=1 Tax=Caerostris extrusa TaxID=172846 RepID=A0AAV4VV40_CAEEX|nr:hypothetical protein CEXT_504041 [Caerostris extrusa]